MPVMSEMEQTTTRSRSGCSLLFKNQQDCIFYPAWLFHTLTCWPTSAIFPRSSFLSPDGRSLLAWEGQAARQGGSCCAAACGCQSPALPAKVPGHPLAFVSIDLPHFWDLSPAGMFRHSPHTQTHTNYLLPISIHRGFLLPTTVTIYLMFLIGHIAKLWKNLRDFQKYLMAIKVSMNFLQWRHSSLQISASMNEYWITWNKLRNRTVKNYPEQMIFIQEFKAPQLWKCHDVWSIAYHGQSARGSKGGNMAPIFNTGSLPLVKITEKNPNLHKR